MPNDPSRLRGPWSWEYDPDTLKPIALVGHGGDILVATGSDSQSWADVSDGAMRMLEATPDLLSAALQVQAMLKAALSGDVSMCDFHEMRIAAIANLDAAVAKALSGGGA